MEQQSVRSLIGRHRFLAGLGTAATLTACGGGGRTLPAPAPAQPGVGASAALAKIPLVIDLSLGQPNLTGMPIYFAVTGQIGSTGNIYYCGPDGMPYAIGNTAPPGVNPTSTRPGQQYASQTLPPALAASKDPTLQANYNTGAAGNWLDLSWPLTMGVQNKSFDLANINATTIPGFGPGLSAFSGRIWLSIGPLKLPFASTGPKALTTPSLTGFPGMFCLFDVIEFSWDGANFFADTTQVDQFGLELRLTLNGTPAAGSNTGQQGALTQTRTTIVNNFVRSAGPPGSPLATLPAGFGGTQVAVATPSVTLPSGAPALYPSNVNYVRVLAPKQTSSEPRNLLLTYYDTLVQSLYKTWTLTPIVISITSQSPTSLNGPYTGLVLTYPATGVQTTALVFFQGNYPTLSQMTTFLQSQGLVSPPAPGTPPTPGVLTTAPDGNTSFAIVGSMASGASAPQNTGNVVITSYDIWQCAGSLANGAANAKAVQNVLASAFNRGILSEGQTAYSLSSTSCPASGATAYYQRDPSQPDTPSNSWSDAWHFYNINGQAYGFPYDDDCNQSTSVNYNIANGSAVVTLAPFI